MTEVVTRLDAPIVPNVGLGGLVLRTKLSDIQDLVRGVGLYKAGQAELIAPFEARYSLGIGEVEVCVDIRNGKVFKLIAGRGYQGSLLEKIAVGMKVQEAMTFVPELYYDEREEGIFLKGYPGVQVDVPEIDPLPKSVPEMQIKAICVFISEIDSPEGRAGTW
jgi:hypothetical protein